MTQADFVSSLRELIAVALQTGPRSEATERGVRELSAVLAESKRRFPIQGGPSIPWAAIEPYNGQALITVVEIIDSLGVKDRIECGWFTEDAEYRTCRIAPEALTDDPERRKP